MDYSSMAGHARETQEYFDAAVEVAKRAGKVAYKYTPECMLGSSVICEVW